MKLKKQLLPVGTRITCRFAGEVWNGLIAEVDDTDLIPYRVTMPDGRCIWLEINEVEELKND